MIAQINSGAQFAGLVNYANDIAKKGTTIVASEGVCTSSNESITASFQTQARMRPGLKNFVGHISLSFAPQDTPKLTDGFMAEVAKEYMKRMGITGTQYVVFRHKDQPHGHVHIVYNRVRNDGTAITGDSNFRKSIAVTKALTREYGLTFGKGKKNVRRERLRGKDAVKYRLYDAIREAMKSCHDWQSLRAALEAKGIRMEVVQRAGGSGRIGIIFTYGKMAFSGGQIDRNLTYNRINQAMAAIGQNETAAPSMHMPGENAAPFDGQSVSSPLVGIADNGAEATAQAENTLPDGTESSTIGGNIGEAAVEIIMQPHAVQSARGGGGGNDRGWRDDDKEKKKNNNKPYSRRR